MIPMMPNTTMEMKDAVTIKNGVIRARTVLTQREVRGSPRTAHRQMHGERIKQQISVQWMMSRSLVPDPNMPSMTSAAANPAEGRSIPPNQLSQCDVVPTIFGCCSFMLVETDELMVGYVCATRTDDEGGVRSGASLDIAAGPVSRSTYS